MTIDLRTLAVILVVTNVLQVVGIALQYRVNRANPAVRWWLFGFSALAAGFALLLAREAIAVKLVTHILANALLLLGMCLNYVGIMRFLGVGENRWAIGAVFAVYFPFYLRYTYAIDDMAVRNAVMSALVAFLCFLSARGLLANKTRAIASSANFLAAVYLFHGAFMALRAVATPLNATFAGVFTPTPMQEATFLVPLMVGFLLTIGLIVMLNQRLHAETTEAKEQFELIFNTGPDAALITRLDDGLIVDINHGFTAMTGYTHDETVGRSVLAVDIWEKPEDRRRIVDLLREKGTHENFEAVFLRKDMTRIIGLMSAKVISLQGGPHILSVTRDITDRKRMEAALAAEKERLVVTLRSIGDGVIACDLGQKVVLLNKAAEEMTGWSAGEALGRPLTEVFHIVSAVTRERCENPAEKAILTGGVVGLANHTLLLSRDGRELAIADSGSPIRDGESRVIGVVLVFRDVTGQEKVEAELARAQKLESLAVLAGGIAHDFNNLLTGILGNISLARSLVPGGEKASERLLEAERAAGRARDLTAQLLTFSRGGAPIRRCIDLGALLEEGVRFALRGSAAACRLDLAPGLSVDVDPGQIGQVVHNLVLNASQAMPDGGTVTVRAEPVSLVAGNRYGLGAGGFARVSVSDEGEGIPAHVLPRIFDPFFTTKSVGKGLGLSICHSIVRNHDGHIEVDSVPGRGATFTIFLPACEGGAEAGAEEPGGQRGAPEGQGERVLVMDDEPMVRDLAQEMLRSLGFDPEGAAEGGAALDLYRGAREEGRPFAVVIMDLTVPGGMGGKEAVGRLRQFDPAARVVVSSGYSNDPIMANYRDHGFGAVLVKPYRMEEMRAVMRMILGEDP
jgi:PAS domain S-box-containing protein